jgi:ribosomal protein S18 acetylase RimI-like enzyme
MEQSPRFIQASHTTEWKDRIPHLLDWIHEASNPYFSWLCGDEAKARSFLLSGMQSSNSELSLSRMTVLFERSVAIGVYIGTPGPELNVCRRQDLLRLAKLFNSDGMSKLRERLASARGLFCAVDADEFYLSRIGVAPSSRGRGYGKELLEHFISAGQARGFRRFRLDVCKECSAAISGYRSAGFSVTSEAKVDCVEMSYYSMSLLASSSV